MSNNPADTGEDHVRDVFILKRIAATLGLPEQVFSEELQPTTEFDELTMLLRIWNDLRNEADRRKVLAFAQTLTMERR